MGINAVTHALDGTEVIPSTDSDWDDWVSASSTRNHVLDDPLLDWLNRHGEAQGFKRDDQATFDERTDFLTFIFRKGAEFESAVVEHLSTLTDVHTVAGSEGGYAARRDLAVAQATFDAMHRGEPIIYQGVVRDAETRTYGSPDLLVRSDVLLELFPGSISPEAAAISARDLGDPGWHYRVVDTKFSTLGLAAGGELGNGGSAPAYKVQVFIYNRALGRLQGYEPPESFLLGRGWEQTLRGETTRVHNCMDRLGPVPQDYSSRTRAPLTVQADAAADWLRRMRGEGHLWKIVPEPSIDELRVNAMGDHAPGSVRSQTTECPDSVAIVAQERNRWWCVPAVARIRPVGVAGAPRLATEPSPAEPARVSSTSEPARRSTTFSTRPTWCYSPCCGASATS